MEELKFKIIGDEQLYVSLTSVKLNGALKMGWSYKSHVPIVNT